MLKHAYSCHHLLKQMFDFIPNGTNVGAQIDLLLDSRLKIWVLIPISIVMVTTGIIKQYILFLIGPKYRGYARTKITELQYVIRAQMLLANGSNIDSESYQMKKDELIKDLTQGKYIAKTNDDANGTAAVNPFNDPNMSDNLMNMAKGNLANFIPQTIIMWWVNYFFSGMLLMKLPFPLTPRFKEMLQSGIMTVDLDVRWVSAISWYFISALGVNPLISLITGYDDMSLQQLQLPQTELLGGAGQPQPVAVMNNMANELTMSPYTSCFDDIESRVLKMYS